MAVHIFLEDALVEKLSTTIKTFKKDVVDNALFKQVKFCRSPKELNDMMGYVFSGLGKREKVFWINEKKDSGQPDVNIFQFGHVSCIKFI